MSKTERQKRREYFRLQKLVGLAIVLLAMIGSCTRIVLGQYGGGILLLGIPAGLYLIFTDVMVLNFGYKLEVKEKQRAQ